MKYISIRLVLIFILLSLASAFQTFVYVIRTPVGFVYPLVHNYEQDYYWYLSLMRQGWDGYIAVTTKFSPEVFPRVFVNTFFPFFGMMARVSGLSLPLTYLILRIIFGAGLFIAGYLLLKQVSVDRKVRITAVAFMVFGAPFFFVKDGTIGQIGEFWTGFDPIMRVTWLPHHLLANICLIISMIMLSQSVKNRSIKTAMIAGGVGIVGGWCNPAALVVLGLSVGIGIGIFILHNRTIRIRELSVWGILCSLPVMAFYSIQNSTFPWTAFRDWERFVTYPIDAVSYMGVLGLVGVIAIFGVPVALKKKTFLWNILVGWFLSPFIGLVISRFLPISNGRFIQGAGYIPAAILAALFLWNTSILKKMTGSVRVAVIVGIILIQVPSFVSSYALQMRYAKQNMANTLVMIPHDYWVAVSWLSSQRADGIIIAPDTVSPEIGAFTKLRTFGGHPTFTFDPQKKQADLQLFYFSQDDTWKQEFIAQWKPEYIWIPPWGPRQIIEEQRYGIVYENPSVILYQK